MRAFTLLWLLCGVYYTSACICIQSTGVNIRDAPCGSQIGQESTGACFSSLGGSQQCELSGTLYNFVSFEYGSGTGWAADDFTSNEPASRCDSTYECSGATIVTREGWGARAPTSTTPLGQTNKYFVHHSAGAACSTESDCEGQVRNIQTYHMDSNGWSDIGYNFLVGEDGRAYVGRGWDNRGAHATDWNSVSHGICVMGDFTSRLPNAAALQTVQNLMQCGISQGAVSSSYTLHGHRDGGNTACPGDQLYAEISGWPNFAGPLADLLNVDADAELEHVHHDEN